MKRTPASQADTLSPLGGAVLVSDVAETAADGRNLVVLRDSDELPPILAGHQTPQLRAPGVSTFVCVKRDSTAASALSRVRLDFRHLEVAPKFRQLVKVDAAPIKDVRHAAGTGGWKCQHAGANTISVIGD